MEDIPTPSPRASARPALGSLTMLWGFAKRYPGRIAGALIALIVSSAATLGIPSGFRLVIDRGFMGGGDISRWFEYLLLIVIILAVASALRFYFVSWLGERVVADIRSATQANLLRQAPRFFEENRPSEIASRMTADTAVVEQVVGSTVSIALRNMVTGVDTVSGTALTGTALANSQRVQAGVKDVLLTGNLLKKPAVIIAGRSDTLVPVNHASRAYAAFNSKVEGANGNLRYYEITNGQHFDAFLPNAAGGGVQGERGAGRRGRRKMVRWRLLVHERRGLHVRAVRRHLADGLQLLRRQIDIEGLEDGGAGDEVGRGGPAHIGNYTK